MPAWTPNITKFDEDIAEESQRVAVLKERALLWQPIPTPAPPDQPVNEVPQTPQWQMSESQPPDIQQPQYEAIDQFLQPDFRLSDLPNTQDTTPQWQPQQQPAPSDSGQPQGPATEPPRALWEQPAVLFGKIGQAVGETVSQVPLLPKFLEFAAPAFEWIQKNVEQPFAATILAPFTPDVPWRQDESWLEHQKRAYVQWDAPTYVKGAAEFAMPLWWIPYFGWAAKGAKAVGASEKVVKGLAAVSKLAGELPTSEVLNQAYKGDFYRTMTNWSEKVPVLNKAVEVMGGPASFVKDIGTVYPVYDIATHQPQLVDEVGRAIAVKDYVNREILKNFELYDMRNSWKAMNLPRVDQLGDYRQILQLDANGIVQAATPLTDLGRTLGRGLSEVIEHPGEYTFPVDSLAPKWIEQTRGVMQDIKNLYVQEGMKTNPELMFHRMVVERELKDEALTRLAAEQGITIEELRKNLGEAIMQKTEYGSSIALERHHVSWEDATMKGVVYNTSVRESLAASTDYAFKQIATKRLQDALKDFGMKPMQKWATIFSEEAKKLSDLGTKYAGAHYAQDIAQKLINMKGTTLPGAQMAKIRAAFPKIASDIESVMSIQPSAVRGILNKMPKELWTASKMTPDELLPIVAKITEINRAFQPFGAKPSIKMSAIADALQNLNADKKVIVRAIEQGYKEAYRLNKQAADLSMRSVRDGMKVITEGAKAEIKPLVGQRRTWLQDYREGKQILGKHETMITKVPAFRGMIFDTEIANLLEKRLAPESHKWLQSLAKISGVGRIVAAMDISAGFIQGLPLFGKNPILWGKAMGRQMEFFASPEHLIKYMNDPTTRLIHAERMKSGGYVGGFEYMESTSAIGKAAGKVPKIGGALETGFKATYGRGEAAYAGFGEYARDQLWLTFRNKAIGVDGVVNEPMAREINRMIDRMTGTMSMAKLGIGRTQIDFENAFGWFAPRYTRASLAYVGDIFKGGFTGRETRETLARLSAAGLAFYYGTSKMLGQQPNLDPTSGRFMTITIGDSHVGIGGAVYALARLNANVIGLALDNEQRLNLLTAKTPDGRLNRDNPFVRWYLSKTSPLTGTLINIVEGKDYIGTPFETPGDWANYMASKVMPLSVSTAVQTGSVSEGLKVAPAAFAGARTFPKSAWELREDARDRESQAKYGQPYAGIPEMQQKLIDQQPSVKSLQEQADRDTENRAGLGNLFLKWKRDRDSARQEYVTILNKAQTAVDMGMADNLYFKDQMQKAQYGLSMTYDHIDAQPQYKEVMSKLKNPKDINKAYIQDVAYNELMVGSAKFEDPKTGMFDFNGYNQFKNELKAKYGDAVWKLVLERKSQKDAELPPLAQAYNQAKEIMAPYWGIQDKVTELFGKRYANSDSGQAMIQRQRRSLRLRDPAIARAYQMFYTRPS